MTAARRAESARVVAGEKRLAEASIKPALAGSLGAQKKLAATGAKPQPKAKKKKGTGKARPSGGDHDDFVAQVPKAKQPA